MKFTELQVLYTDILFNDIYPSPITELEIIIKNKFPLPKILYFEPMKYFIYGTKIIQAVKHERDFPLKTLLTIIKIHQATLKELQLLLDVFDPWYEPKTKVKFVKIKGEDVAIFPEEKWDYDGNIASYSHIGQHSGCHPNFLENEPCESYDLFFELRSIGYNLELL